MPALTTCDILASRLGDVGVVDQTMRPVLLILLAQGAWCDDDCSCHGTRSTPFQDAMYAGYRAAAAHRAPRDLP